MGVGAVGVGWDRGVVGCWSTGTLLAFFGHWDALQACGCPSLGQPLGHRWPPWLLGHSAGTWSMCGQLLVSCWSTDGLRGRWGALLAHGQRVANCWPTVAQPLAFVAAGAHSQLVVNCWSTVGQLLVSFWSTVGLCGHWGSQPARGQPLVNCWSAFGQPLAFVAAGTLCWLVVNAWPTVGQPLVYRDNIGLHSCLGALLVRGQPVANCWSTIGQLGQHWDTTGTPLGHHRPLWPPGHTVTHGQPVASRWSTKTPLAFLATGGRC